MDENRSYVPVAIGHYDGEDLIIGKVEYFSDYYEACDASMELAARKAIETGVPHMPLVLQAPRMAKNFWGDEM